jgi:titin
LPIAGYILYWDEGLRSSGNFTQLARVDSYDHNFFNVTGGMLKSGATYRFQVSALNLVGEGPLSEEIEARAASVPGKLSLPVRVTSEKIDASTASITIKWY